MPVAGGEGEALRLTLAHVDDELGVGPALELAAVDVEGRPGHVTEVDVPAAEPELALGEAHGEAPVATPTRLEEHDRAPLGDECRNRPLGGRGGDHPRFRTEPGHARSQKNPSGDVL